MATIEIRSPDLGLIQTLSQQISQDLSAAGLADDLHIDFTNQQQEATKGDPVTMTVIMLTAVGAGGALTALLGKDGFLSALARVLEKYVEGRKAQVTIKQSDGSSIEVSGPVGEIKQILKQIND
jgi:hypothetical protein